MMNILSIRIMNIIFFATVFLCQGNIVYGQSSASGKFVFKSDASPYIDAISKNTIVFGVGVRMTGGDAFFKGIGKPGGPPSLYPGFPLQISATIIDEEVITESGDYYANLGGLTDTEKDSFLLNYRNHYKLDEYDLIWIYMRTTFAENYVNPEYWVIFVQDEDENQFEPQKISEEALLTKNGNYPAKERWRRAQTKEIQFALLLPKKKFDGGSWIPESGNLKIVFMNPNKQAERAEGTWIFKSE